MAAPVGLVDIVRDFIVVHQRFRSLFENFRAGDLHFEDVKHLVADGDSSVLFRLKERVHGLYRERDPALPLRRGEALFDLAVGSLFHEALKFRENLYQLEVYGPKVRALREAGTEDVDGLLAEFEKILRAASDRLAESLRETETLLEQTRRQLPGLLAEVAAEGAGAVELGLVTRFVLAERKAVEAAYPEGVASLFAGVHEDLRSAFLGAIRSHLESAHFDRAQTLIAEARAAAPPTAESGRELDQLDAYAAGMRAFRDGRYPDSVARMRDWAGMSGRTSAHEALARALLERLPKLVDPGEDGDLLREARDLTQRFSA
jgi:hypothetical protein